MENLRYEIAKSDVLKIFVVGALYMGILLMARVYFQMNAQSLAWFESNTYPWLVVTKDSLTRPWVFLTHALTEYSIVVFVSNFIWLYFFGFIIEDLHGKFSVMSIMLVVAIVTGLVAALLAKFMPAALAGGYYLGMRTCVIGVAAASVFYNPMYRVLHFIRGGVPIWIVGVIFLLLSIGAGGGDFANLVCILIAIALGFFYSRHLQGLFMKVQALLRRLDGVGVDRKTTRNTARVIPIEPTHKIVNVEQAKIDKILDKISEQGMDSLTASEKEWLDAYSKKQGD